MIKKLNIDVVKTKQWEDGGYVTDKYGKQTFRQGGFVDVVTKSAPTNIEITEKINEIIDYINKQEKQEKLNKKVGK